eukprot:tig00000241_g20939.t1
MSSGSETHNLLYAIDGVLATITAYKFLKKFWMGREARRAALATKRKPVRVWMDGCFDMFHFGHANALRQAKALGDVLVVGICPDDEILKHKGPPVMNDAERVGQVEACKWVDEVVTNVPYEVSQEFLDHVLEKYQIDFFVHGDDECLTADGKDAYEAVKKAGRFRTVKRTEGVSSTDIVGRMLLMTKTHHNMRASEDDTDDEGRPFITRERTLSRESVEPMAAGPSHKARVSHFLPTSRRLIQFSAGRAVKPDDVVVYVDGAFDLFHTGHIETLRKARELGTFLLVGIHDDLTVNKFRGSNYPIMNLHERTLSVLSCKYVDEVIIGAPWAITEDMVRTMNIKRVVHGTRWDETLDMKNLNPDPYAVPKRLGIYKEVSSTSELSAAEIVRRVIANRQRYEKKYKSKSAKENQYLEKKQYVQEV